MAVADLLASPPPVESVAACPVCKNAGRKKLFRTHDWLFNVPGEFTLVGCRECGLAYLAERPTQESLGRYYPSDAYYAYHEPAAYSLFGSSNPLAKLWYGLKKGILSHEYNYTHLGGSKLLARLAQTPFLKPLHDKATFDLDALLHPYVENGSLLDVGCGAGMYLDLMRALGWQRVTGVDVSADAIEQAREKLNLEVYCGQLKEVELEPNSFDAVSLSHTLEHVPDPVAFLEDIKHVMKPAGRLAIVVPNTSSLSSRIFHQYWRGWEPPRHLINFSPSSLRLALERAGFEVKELRTTPRSAYWFSIMSYSRAVGDNAPLREPQPLFTRRRRLRAHLLGLIERAQCATGMASGEELIAVGIKPE